MHAGNDVRGHQTVALALTEQTTSPQNRLDALQAWNGLGLNNIGK